MSEKKSWSVPGAHFGSDPEFFTAWTLYDIGPLSEGSRENLNNLMRVINSRGQPLLAGIECIENQDIDNSLFGENLNGLNRVWCFKWIASAIGQMSEETLTSEAHGLQMVTGLNETLPLNGTILTNGPDKNTFFIRHDSF
jgi:hypothetical protein